MAKTQIKAPKPKGSKRTKALTKAERAEADKIAEATEAAKRQMEELEKAKKELGDKFDTVVEKFKFYNSMILTPLDKEGKIYTACFQHQDQVLIRGIYELAKQNLATGNWYIKSSDPLGKYLEKNFHEYIFVGEYLHGENDAGVICASNIVNMSKIFGIFYTTIR